MDYSKCHQTDHENNGHEGELDLDFLPQTQANTRTWTFGFWLAQSLMFMLSASMLILGLLSRRSCASSCRDADVAWSPVIEVVKPHLTKFNETFFFQPKYPSQFRGSPSPAIDNMWDEYTKNPMLDGRTGTLAVSRDTIEKLGRSHEPGWEESLVKMVDSGEERYMATLEIYHHLHCLNMLRKVAHPSYYADKHLTHADVHLDHCIETVREALMCNAGTGVAMFHWIKGNDKPWPDYNTVHQCRDPDSVLNWSLQNAVPIRGPFSKPEGVIELLSPLY